jgi:hypothetical protein
MLRRDPTAPSFSIFRGMVERCATVRTASVLDWSFSLIVAIVAGDTITLNINY